MAFSAVQLSSLLGVANLIAWSIMTVGDIKGRFCVVNQLR